LVKIGLGGATASQNRVVQHVQGGQVWHCACSDRTVPG